MTKREPKEESGAKLFTVKELDWFCKNAYNIGLRNMDAWDLHHTVRVFDACLEFIKLYPPDIPAEDATNLSLKTMLCNFVVASALVASARAQDNIDQQLQDYTAMRDYAAAFDTELQRQVQGLGETLLQDLGAKLATLLVFEFEAVVYLKSWDELGTVVRKAASCGDGDAFKKMADCLLREGVPPQRELHSFSTQEILVV